MQKGWFLAGIVIGFLLAFLSGFATSVDKPVVYFYPDSPTLVSATLTTNELVTRSEPFVGWLSPVSWRFTALPNSTLLFDGGRASYPYLFYETSYAFGGLPLREGWSVPAEELDALLARELPRLGLNERESGEFREYWLNRLPPSPYYSVYVVPRPDIDAKLSLAVSPAPDSVVRVILGFKPTAVKEDVLAPVIQTPLRRGFTVVEWGGFVAN